MKVLWSWLFGDEGLFYWRDALTPVTVRCWRSERQKNMFEKLWTGWRLVRVFGVRVALVQKGPW